MALGHLDCITSYEFIKGSRLRPANKIKYYGIGHRPLRLDLGYLILTMDRIYIRYKQNN